jgi:heme exporter protein D
MGQGKEAAGKGKSHREVEMAFITFFVIFSIAMTLVFGIALAMASMDDTDRENRLDDEEQQRYLEEWMKKKKRRS